MDVRLLTVEEAAAFLGVAPSTLYDWCAARLIPHVRLRTAGGARRSAIRFTPQLLEEHLRKSVVPVGKSAA